jgi:arylsulfatase A-like enzyme
MKSPNIVFITIDSLRSDKVFGELKKSYLPNLEKIINNGLFFPNTISSVDATDPSLGCIFTGKYPFNIDITLFKNHEKASFLFDHLKKIGYSRYSMLPNKTFFNTLSKNFEKAEKYDIDPYVLLYHGTGDRILEQLESNAFVEPWIYYVHLMDLHPSGHQFFHSKEFDDGKYGDNGYEKVLSGIDVWIGKILKKINLSTTIFILTSDHGDFIPENGKRIDDIYPIALKLRPLKKILPFNDNFWESSMKVTKFFVKKMRSIQLEKKGTEFEKRSYLVRVTGNLFDESIRVPLLLYGCEKYAHQIFQNQVSHIDILPTLLYLLDQPIPSDIDGTNLFSLMSDNSLKSRPVYFESASTSAIELGLSLGIRTDKYKYFRTRKKSDIHLYDIKDDPYEKNNLVNDLPQIVNDMEEILRKLQKSNHSKEHLSDIINQKRSSLRLE